jgi:oxalate decarboxylase/phosphoglucose isomerase-like protein (cupin superfamily)
MTTTRSFPITRVLQDDDGTTHVEDGEIVTRASGAIGFLSDAVDPANIVFRVTDGDYDYDWHPAPTRQFVLMLTGAIEITVGDGETRTIRAGETILLEDTRPPGHRTRNVGETPRYSVFVATDAAIPYRHGRSAS